MITFARVIVVLLKLFALGFGLLLVFGGGVCVLLPFGGKVSGAWIMAAIGAVAVALGLLVSWLIGRSLWRGDAEPGQEAPPAAEGERPAVSRPWERK